MADCSECGKPLGSNPKCETCLKFLMEQGTKEYDESDAEEAVGKAEGWMEKRGKSAPEKLFAEFKLLYMMLRDYVKGIYREVSWYTIAAIIFAILYVINPFDLIPDFIPVLGWLDDAAVVALVLKAIESDLKKYCKETKHEICKDVFESLED